MIEWFWRIRSKIVEIFDKIPGLPEIYLDEKFKKKLENEAPLCEHCFPKDGKGGLYDLPDDFDDIKLEKEEYTYDIKLPNLRPYQWKMVGRNLLNMAYKDPQYGKKPDDDTDEEDPLPPPPEPSEYMKATKYPLISVNLKGITWVKLEEIGELFYHGADYMEMGKNGKPMLDPPTDGTNMEEIEALKNHFMNPEKTLEKELTVNKKITMADVLPGETSKPYKEDYQDWIDQCEKEAPISDDDLQEYEL